MTGKSTCGILKESRRRVEIRQMQAWNAALELHLEKREELIFFRSRG